MHLVNYEVHSFFVNILANVIELLKVIGYSRTSDYNGVCVRADFVNKHFNFFNVVIRYVNAHKDVQVLLWLVNENSMKYNNWNKKQQDKNNNRVFRFH